VLSRSPIVLPTRRWVFTFSPREKEPGRGG
jgi:hypothetical protein